MVKHLTPIIMATVLSFACVPTRNTCDYYNDSEGHMESYDCNYLKSDQFLKDQAAKKRAFEKAIFDKTDNVFKAMEQEKLAERASAAKRAERKTKELLAKSNASKLPRCDSREVEEHLRKAIRSRSSGHVALEEMRGAEEFYYFHEEDLRLCSAIGYFTSGKSEFTFSIEWMDADHSTYWVEIQR